MVRQRLVFFLVFVGTISATAELPAVRGYTVPAETTVPYTYCIGYLPDPESDSFLNPLASSPPDLYHIGYHIPFKGALGPTYGHELFTDDILTPDEIPREIERIERVIAKIRAAGVGRLIPYVYTMAFFGHPDKRTGFFNFYDRWDEYREFGLGPKPAADPSLWSQVRGPQPLGGGPPDALHYNPCINHPAWSEFLDLVVRQLAAVGYDGMFFDVNTQYCYCPHCQEKFDVYLLEKYGRRGLEEHFGTSDHRELDISTIYRDFERTILDAFRVRLNELLSGDLGPILGLKESEGVSLDDDWRLLRCYMQDSAGEFPPADGFREYLVNRFGSERAAELPESKRDSFIQEVLRHEFRGFLKSPRLAGLLEERFGSSDVLRRCCSKPRDLLLWVETQRFWSGSMASCHARLKKVGQVVFEEQGRDDNFYTVANLGPMSTVDALNKRRVDAIDLVHWAPMSDMQMFEEMQQPGSLKSGVILSNIFAFKWAMAAGTRAGPLLYGVTDDRAADLAEAEVAAGGGGAFIQGGLAAPESRKRWKQFFTEHGDLWDEGISYARVGVLFWSDQVYYEYPEHFSAVHALVRILSETQTPFDLITEEGTGQLGRYDVVIAPRLPYLDDRQIAVLVDYAEQGGNLVIIDPFGTKDKHCRARTELSLDNGQSDAYGFRHVPCDGGRILRLDPELVPKRRSDFHCLMEERSNAFIPMREYLNGARQADLENGVDLGLRFVTRLEKSLETTLRWCPSNTDAGVYVHPYRLPRREDRSDRVVVHLVNYRLPIRRGEGVDEEDTSQWFDSTKTGDPSAAVDLRITVPLPPRSEVKGVATLSPTDETSPVSWEILNGSIAVTVPRLEIYQTLTIDLELDSP